MFLHASVVRLSTFFPVFMTVLVAFLLFPVIRRESQGLSDAEWDKGVRMLEITQRETIRRCQNEDLVNHQRNYAGLLRLFDEVKSSNALFRLKISQVCDLIDQDESDWRMMGGREQFESLGLQSCLYKEDEMEQQVCWLVRQS